MSLNTNGFDPKHWPNLKGIKSEGQGINPTRGDASSAGFFLAFPGSSLAVTITAQPNNFYKQPTSGKGASFI